MDIVPLKEIRRKPEKKHGKLMAKNENNEFGEELSLDNIESNLVGNVIPKSKAFGQSSKEMPIL